MNEIRWLVEGSRVASGGPVIIAQAVNLTSLLAVRAERGLLRHSKHRERQHTRSSHILESRPIFLSRQLGHRSRAIQS